MVMGVTIRNVPQETLHQLDDITGRLYTLETRMTNLETKVDQVLLLLSKILEKNAAPTERNNQIYPSSGYPRS